MARKDQISHAIMFKRGLTSSEVTTMTTLAQEFDTAMGRAPGQTDKRVIVTGDSHTAYWNNKALRRMDWLLPRLGYEYYPVGVSGQTLAAINTNYASAGKEASYYKASRTYNIIFIWAGTNDISAGATLSDLQTRMTTFVTSAKATGYKVIIVPTMARDFLGDSTKTLLIDSWNVDLAANWSSTYGADYFTGHPAGNNFYNPRANFASDADYIAANQTITSNATYYTDGTHLTQNTGYKMWGDLFATKLAEYVATLP